MWRAAANGFVRAFLAPACAGCDQVLDAPLASPVCDACWRAVARITQPFCDICGDQDTARPDWTSREAGGLICPRCAARPPSFSVARSAGRYDGPFRNVIHAFKYGGRRPLARGLAAVMKDAGAGVLEGADAVVPVPLHPWRALRRGFNQADDLAVCLGLPVWRVLRRARYGSPQAALPASERPSNVSRAFALGPIGGVTRAWCARRLRDRTVVLVDDVMTTGATLDACGDVLLAAGVRTVRALTAARAVATQPTRSHGRPRRATARHR